MEAAAESVFPLMKSPACSRVPFWESDCGGTNQQSGHTRELKKQKYLQGRACLVGERLAPAVRHDVYNKIDDLRARELAAGQTN
jgi:hypothetical protein